MQRYNNGKIYAIRSHQTDRVYIGSTCMPLAKRLYAHRRDKKRYENGRFSYVTSFTILEFDDHYIELVEEFACDNKMQLERREGQVIRATENCVNKNVAGRTCAEYYQDNAEQIKQYQKEYRRDNAELIKQKDRERHQRPDVKQRKNKKHDCPCGGKYTTAGKSVHLKTKKHRDYIEFMNLTEEQVRALLYL